jgi:hypothetical protein
MALVDISATNEDNILSGENLEELVEEDMKYRDLQIKRLQKEILDMEDLQDTITLSDFTLDDFRFDLMGFLNKNKKLLQETPDGIYAIVNNIFTSSIDPKISVRTNAGVIFLLRNKSQASLKENINPYHPYYLVYIKSDGSLEYGYTNPKQILDVYRSLCAGKKEPLEELCKQFDRETEDGKNMESYNKLIKSAIDSIVGKVKKANFANLGYGGTGKLEKESNLPTKAEDFELITWLVIKE